MLLDFLIDFWEVALHQILYSRGVYPERIFIKCKKYGVPIWKSEHPWINQYLLEHLRSLKAILEKRQLLERFDLVILDGTNVLETYAFEFDAKRIERDKEESSGLFDSNVFSSVELQFRTMLLKISASLSRLEPSTPESDMSFTFKIQSNVQSALEITQDLKWCVKEEGKIASQRSNFLEGEDAANKESTRIIPIFGMKDPFQLQIYGKICDMKKSN